jgi:hypothetical protein
MFVVFFYVRSGSPLKNGCVLCYDGSFFFYKHTNLWYMIHTLCSFLGVTL